MNRVKAIFVSGNVWENTFLLVAGQKLMLKKNDYFAQANIQVGGGRKVKNNSSYHLSCAKTFLNKARQELNQVSLKELTLKEEEECMGLWALVNPEGIKLD